MIGSPDGVIFIDPFVEGNNENYLSYYKKDRLPNDVDAVIDRIADGDQQPLMTGPMLRGERTRHGETGWGGSGRARRKGHGCRISDSRTALWRCGVPLFAFDSWQRCHG